ncbi:MULTISPECIES: DUF397 domain-containing protein [Streptomyces]|uniref:DUF397 domain-containing protein n=1 Tax=Streptomyces melanosporofaciens TaxID=67327 RepID=A0A1H4PJ88_STRMJ|nr:DUF397 domain-containing protein [Streptomyces melanosporofaciens]SEC07274.1 protein of unknown function [Streptomyces melanosporofaciens]
MTLKPSDSAPQWIKSSYSTDDGPSCVEVAWTKSSYSSNEGPSCVEVATTLTRGTIHIRDSKNPNGPRLAVTPASWTAFVHYASNN